MTHFSVRTRRQHPAKRRRMVRAQRAFALLASLALLVLVLPQAAAQDRTPGGHRLEALELSDGSSLQYVLEKPEGIEGPVPTVLLLPPGPQTAAMVDFALAKYMPESAVAQGYAVVSPVAPGGTVFYAGSERAIPELLDAVSKTIDIEGGKFHLAGVSNGGRSAFRVGTLYPERFSSMTVLPGFPPGEEDVARLDRLRGMSVAMYAGGDDKGWVTRMERTAARLRELGVEVSLKVFPGEGHVPPSMTPEVLLARLAAVRAGGAKVGASTTAAVATDEAPGAKPPSPAPTNPEREAVDRVLDALHTAAAEADAERYFGLFTDDGIFFGTDPGERWTVPEFRTWAAPYFERDSAWTFVPRDRHVFFGEAGDTAWFDEIAESESYGACRGTGALRKIGGTWKIAQYNLTIPVPNDLAKDLVRKIRGEAAPATRVIAVRHAEKQGPASKRDPELTAKGHARADRLAALLAGMKPDAIYATQFQRTQQTVEPTAIAIGLEETIVDARDVEALAETIRTEHAGHTVLVAGHSNTVPALLRELGCESEISIAEDDYGNLYIVTIRGGETTLVRLRY